MRNCGVGKADRFTPPPFWFNPSTVFDVPPPLSGEALNGDFFKNLQRYFQGSPERGAGKPKA